VGGRRSNPAIPKEHRTKLHATNPIERLNGEIKRRTDVTGLAGPDAKICPSLVSHALHVTLTFCY
jgi:transposase-like protein